MSIRILLADDHNLIRQGLRSLLEKQADIEVVGEAAEGQAALNLAKETSPDIIVMDVSMPGLNGIEATRQIVSDNPEVKVLALSMYADKRFVIGMLRAGASGYMPKDCAFEELVQGIRAIVANEMYLSPTITATFVNSYLHQLNNDGAKFSPLTPKELEVLRLLAEGETTRDVANRLSVSVKTVETHRQHITEKLKLHSLADLVKYAIREGIASLDE